MYTQTSITIPRPWIKTNPTMYSTPTTHAVTFGISIGMESAKLGFLSKSYAQLISVAVW